MSYLVIEIQKSNEGACAVTPVQIFDNKQQAEQAYHGALAFAAVSSIDVHSVVMLDHTGTRLKGETYYHGQEPTPDA